jgi:hypothetical protein
MAKAGQRKCLCCKGLFDPDPRNINRQRYCSNTDCRLASKLASQAAWFACRPGERHIPATAAPNPPVRPRWLRYKIP